MHKVEFKRLSSRAPNNAPHDMPSSASVCRRSSHVHTRNIGRSRTAQRYKFQERALALCRRSRPRRDYGTLVFGPAPRVKCNNNEWMRQTKQTVTTPEFHWRSLFLRTCSETRVHGVRMTRHERLLAPADHRIHSHPAPSPDRDDPRRTSPCQIAASGVLDFVHEKKPPPRGR